MKSFLTPADRYMHLGLFPPPTVQRIGIGDAPAFLHGLRMLFVSDVHLRPHVSHAKLDMLIDLMGAQGADMLLLGGDYAETTADCKRFFRALEALHFPLGGFAVPGNNDLSSGDALAEMAEHANVRLLKNTSVSLALPGGQLAIAGCDDHKYGFPRTKELFKDTQCDYRLLLSHFPVLPDCRCDLMLSGHTHAGQFNFFGITPYTLGFERRFHMLGVRGMKKVENTRVLIGNGIGVSRFPLRLGARAEIYLLEFHDEDFL